jgi:hypothetical protein
MNNYRYVIKKKLLSRSGQVAVLSAILITVLLGITALVIDVGSLYQKRGFYQTVADAAALAGAHELPEEPHGREGATGMAIEYAARNNVDILYDCRDYTSEDIEISQTYAQDDTITVTLSNREAPLYFARIFGKDTVSLSAAASAMVGSPVQVYGVVPWAMVIPEDEGWRDWLWDAAVGEDKKVISGELEDTDFIAWDTQEEPGQWNLRYKDRIINGYQEPLEAGDFIFTREINITQTVIGVQDRIETWDSFYDLTFEDLITDGYGNIRKIIKLAENDDQFVIVPIIYDTELQEWLEAQQGRKPGKPPEEWPEVWVEIKAFAPFIITEITGHGSKAEIRGRFIHQALIINNSEIEAFSKNPHPVGLKVIRLIK